MDVATIGLIEDEDILLDLASLALIHLDHESTDIVPYLGHRCINFGANAGRKIARRARMR
jgi:hypothetical protein